MALEKCDACGGTGRNRKFNAGPCDLCGGSGQLNIRHVVYVPETKMGAFDADDRVPELQEEPRPGYVTKDSGRREEFVTGMVRDVQEGKLRLDLIPLGVLKRDAELLGRGAAKYGDNNWKLGQPFSRACASILRHYFQWVMGDESEDHLAAVRFGAMTLMWYQDEIRAGRLPAELDDREKLR
jgi:hypothetical protein